MYKSSTKNHFFHWHRCTLVWRNQSYSFFWKKNISLQIELLKNCFVAHLPHSCAQPSNGSNSIFFFPDAKTVCTVSHTLPSCNGVVSPNWSYKLTIYIIHVHRDSSHCDTLNAFRVVHLYNDIIYVIILLLYICSDDDGRRPKAVSSGDFSATWPNRSLRLPRRSSARRYYY